MNEVYASWHVSALPEDVTDFYISCGAGDEQFPGYFIDDEGSRLTITSLEKGFDVELTARTGDIERFKDYWLSPSYIEGEAESDKFGIREVQNG